MKYNIKLRYFKINVYWKVNEKALFRAEGNKTGLFLKQIS